MHITRVNKISRTEELSKLMIGGTLRKCGPNKEERTVMSSGDGTVTFKLGDNFDFLGNKSSVALCSEELLDKIIEMGIFIDFSLTTLTTINKKIANVVKSKEPKGKFIISDCHVSFFGLELHQDNTNISFDYDVYPYNEKQSVDEQLKNYYWISLKFNIGEKQNKSVDTDIELKFVVDLTDLK